MTTSEGLSSTQVGSVPASDGAETARLAAVRHYDVLDSAPEEAFDRIAALAARFLGTRAATVTLVDSDRIWFKARHGLGDVTEVTRDPGLCASAILQDDPYVITDAAADPHSRDNPLVTGESGVRFYAAAPITTAEGHRLGTVDVLDSTTREVSEGELTTLRDLAAIALDELELRLNSRTTVGLERAMREQAERDRAEVETFASTLQRTLVPPALPPVPGLEIATHYRTASPRQVGGDFYDLFSLGNGKWAFALGDVCGKGAPAATLTSFVRYTLRALATHLTDPVDVLTELNTALLAEQSPTDHTRFCTAVFGLLEPDHTGTGTQLTLASGGHPPAYLLRTGGRLDTVHPAGGMLIGALADARFATRSAVLGAGDTLLLYTDGLTEARTPGGEIFGEDALAAFLSERTDLGARELVEDVTGLLHDFTEVRDDVAVLALSASGAPGLEVDRVNDEPIPGVGGMHW